MLGRSRALLWVTCFCACAEVMGGARGSRCSRRRLAQSFSFRHSPRRRPLKLWDLPERHRRPGSGCPLSAASPAHRQPLLDAEWRNRVPAAVDLRLVETDILHQLSLRLENGPTSIRGPFLVSFHKGPSGLAFCADIRGWSIDHDGSVRGRVPGQGVGSFPRWSGQRRG